ncbi:actin, cytoplasmic 2 [Pelomyxa schiedti]|nr:actin, cytoplasmic 2 [Pelomyxa schiedti]
MSGEGQDPNVCIVMDTGCETHLAGFAGDDTPRCCTPAIVGRPKNGADIRPCVGNDALAKRALMTLKNPVERGIVTNWDDMECMWRDTLCHQLEVTPAAHPVIVTEPILNPPSNRQRTAQIMFESIGIPSMYVSLSALLAVWATGELTGLSINVGGGVTQILPVSGGHFSLSRAKRLDFGGRDLTDYLVNFMNRGGSNITSVAEKAVIRDLKEKLCYVALDFGDEMKKAESPVSIEQQYEMPDGRIVTLGPERFKCPEFLFQPELLGMDSPGLHTLTHNAIKACDRSAWKDMYSAIAISGGTTLFPGFGDRMAKEMRALVSTPTKIRVVLPPERKFSVWIGGSILGSLTTFKEIAVTKEQYSESGPALLLSKGSDQEV